MLLWPPRFHSLKGYRLFVRYLYVKWNTTHKFCLPLPNRYFTLSWNMQMYVWFVLLSTWHFCQSKLVVLPRNSSSDCENYQASNFDGFWIWLLISPPRMSAVFWCTIEATPYSVAHIGHIFPKIRCLRFCVAKIQFGFLPTQFLRAFMFNVFCTTEFMPLP